MSILWNRIEKGDLDKREVRFVFENHDWRAI